MKFVSKQNNYRVVLRPGIPAERATGRSMQPGLYVHFEDGVAEVKDEEMIQLMLNHSDYDKGEGQGGDFLSVEEGQKDPHADKRKSTEPEHNIMELEHGHMVANLNPKPRVVLNPDQKKAVNEMAVEMAKEMAKEMAPQMAKNIVKELATAVKDTKSKGQTSTTGKKESNTAIKKAENISNKPIIDTQAPETVEAPPEPVGDDKV